MEWTKGDLLQAIANKDEKIRNYFDTFGVVVIRGMLDRQEFKKLVKEYDHQYDLRANRAPFSVMLRNRLGFSGPKRYGFKYILRSLYRRDGMRFLPGFVDASEVFTQHFFSEQMKSIYRYFAGERFLYLGSDGSHFITTSFPWHRDWYTQMPIMKFNYYFNKLPFFWGRFKVIPGSNFTSDHYARLLQKSMAWPMQNKLPGGLAENEFLPQIENPRNSPLRAMARRWKVRFGLAKPLPTVPHVSIRLRRGDIVIFDQRLIHCVESNFPSFSRRLLTMLLSKNAFDFSDDHYLLKQGNTREGLMREIVDLVVSERNHINCPRYGEALEKHSLTQSAHFIDINKIETGTQADASRYNVGHLNLGEGARYTSVLDVKHYADIGADFRQVIGNHQKDAADKRSQEYSYGDVHLGINAQNIRPIKNT